jgi:Chromo (CHRromatin Organisation MOdifier) domain
MDLSFFCFVECNRQMGEYFKPLSKEAADLLNELYYRDGFMNGRDKLWRTFVSKNPGVPASRRAVWDWLRHQEIHSLHQRPNLPRSSQRPISAGVTKLGSIQADSISLPAFNRIDRCVTAVDVFSRRFYLYPVRDATPESTIKALTAFLNQGMKASTIQLDLGTEFKGDLPKFCEERGITLRYARAHSPWTQGVIERYNGIFKAALYKWMEVKGDNDWLSLAPKIVDNMNNSPTYPLNKSPMQVEQDETLHSPLSEKMLSIAGKKYRGQQKGNDLEVGQYVRVLLDYDASGIRSTRQGYWKREIYRVRQVVQVRKYMNRQPVYRLENEAGELMKNSFARWQLNPVPPPSEIVRIPEQVVRPAAELDEEGEKVWEVEALVDRKVVKATRRKPATVMWKIRWKGYKKTTWEPEENLSGSEDLIEEYNRTHGPPRP